MQVKFLKNLLKPLIFLSIFVNFLYGNCENKLFDLSIVEPTSTDEILDEFALMCKFSVIIKDDKAKQTLNLTQKNIFVNNKNLPDILDILIRERNLHHDFDGKILRVQTLKTQTFNLNYITSIREGQSITKASVDARSRQSDYMSNDETSSEDNMIKSLERFDFWQSIEKELVNLLNHNNDFEPKSIIVNQNTGLISINGTLLQLNKANSYIDTLQKRLKRQVIINVNIIAVNLDNTHNSGINWQNFNFDFNSQNANSTNSLISFQNTNDGNFFVKNLGFNAGINFSSVMNFLSTNGKTKVLSSPKLVALNNQQAIISVGDTINYQVKESSKSTDSGTTVSEIYNNYSIFIGILLNILPEISEDGKIILRISPSLSNFKYAQDNKRQDEPRVIAPDTVQKKLSTVVQMENNQTLILGGLISQNEALEKSEVNGLSKIPLLGNLFKGSSETKNSTEIVFIITPLIVDENYNPSLKDLGFSGEFGEFEGVK